jgi:hypothetical protein
VASHRRHNQILNCASLETKGLWHPDLYFSSRNADATGLIAADPSDSESCAGEVTTERVYRLRLTRTMMARTSSRLMLTAILLSSPPFEPIGLTDEPAQTGMH